MYDESEGGIGPPANWELDPIHYNAAERTSRALNLDADPALDAEDAYQEALLYIATASERFRNLDWGYLAHELTRMVGRALNIYGRRFENPLDDELSVLGERATPRPRSFTDGWASRPTPPEFAGRTYTPAVVEIAMPCVWFEDYGLNGFPNPCAPPHDSPKAAGNPKMANTHFAVRADIERAWRLAPLTHRDRQVLLLRCGFDSKYDEIRDDLGYADHTGALRAVDRAILKITNHLNGTEVALDECPD